jgi:hypothetical protein
LVFIALLNEIVQFSAGWCLHIQNSDQKSLRLCINRRRDLLALSANSRCLLTRSLFHGDRAALFLSLVMNSQRNQVQVRAGKRRAAFWRKQDFPNLKRAREQRLTQLERSRPYYPVGSKETHQMRQARLDGGRFRVKGPKVYETIKTPDDKCAEIYRGMRSINLPT